MPEYFEQVRGTSATTGTLILTVHLLGLVAGRFASAFWGGRLSNAAVIGPCLASGAFVVPGVLALFGVCFFGARSLKCMREPRM